MRNNRSIYHLLAIVTASTSAYATINSSDIVNSLGAFYIGLSGGEKVCKQDIVSDICTRTVPGTRCKSIIANLDAWKSNVPDSSSVCTIPIYRP